MKSGILSDFYSGNLLPSERQMVKDSEAIRTSAELSNAENQLRKMLDAESLMQLERMVKAQLTLNSIIAEANYIDGFKTGARFMMDILDDSNSELEPVTG